jgi:hypothetical protein
MLAVFPSPAGAKRRVDKQHYGQGTDAMYAVNAEHVDSEQHGKGGSSRLDRQQAREHRIFFRAVTDELAEPGEPTGKDEEEAGHCNKNIPVASAPIFPGVAPT